MMQVYYSRVMWVNGIAFFLAFLLTFWPTRHRMIVAAALWAIGTLSLTGLQTYDQFLRGAIGSAFSPSGGFPLFSWLFPLVSVILAAIETWFLLPFVSQERALRAGKVLWLAVVPIVVLLTSLGRMGGYFQFPLGIMWLAFPLLWFRIRELLHDRIA